MSRALRTLVAALILATFAAVAPSHAFSSGRRSFNGTARIESAARGFFAFLLRLFDGWEAGEKTGSTMDPNGNS